MKYLPIKNLLIKEMRQLKPIVYLWLGIIALGYAFELATSRIDEESYASWCSEYCDVGVQIPAAIITMVLVLVMAYSLFPREHDDATIDFLTALPVSRRAIFIAKFCAAWLLLCALIVFEHALSAGLLALNPASIDGRFYPKIDTTIMLRDCMFAFIILSYGIFLSWFRTLGLLLLCIYLLVLWWAESSLGSVGVFSVFRVMENAYDGQSLVVHRSALITHALVAIVLLVVAQRLWSTRESRPHDAQKKISGRRWLSILSGIAGFTVLAVAMMYQVGVGSGQLADVGTVATATDHYRFVYAAGAEERAQQLIDSADADYLELAELLAAEKPPTIQVDLTARSEHVAGLATWKKIKMDLSAFRDADAHRRVLSHESAHVFQAVESDRALARNYNAARFFIEGMAQYTSFTLAPDEKRRSSNWHVAAVAWKRQHITFQSLINDANFGETHDAELYYSLGDIWTDALVASCGQDVLGNLLRAAGRPDAPQDLSPAMFWRDTLQYTGCELESVNATWRRQMAGLFESFGDAQFPQFSDVVIRPETDSSRILIQARVSAASADQLPQRFSIRIGSDAQLSAAVNPVFTGKLSDEAGHWSVEFSVPGSAIPRKRFRYQLGYVHQADARAYFDRWQNGSVPR